MTKKTSLTRREHTFTAIYDPVDEGYQVTVPSLPSLVTYGRDFKEAQLMAREAIRCHVEGLRLDQEIVPAEESLIQEKVTVLV